MPRVLPHTQDGVAYDDYSDVTCSARPALRLLQRRQRVVDRSLRCEPALLRLGFCCERHRRWCFAERNEVLAVASCVYHDHRRRNRVLLFASLFSISVVKC